MSLINKQRIAIACIAALFGLLSFHGLAPVQAQGDEDNQSRLNPPQAQYTANGVEGCLECHAGDEMTLMAKTAHGNKDNPHTPYANNSCESCHGPGSFHSSRARGGVGKPALLDFHPWQSSDLHDKACMSCHAKDMDELAGIQKWDDSVHEIRGMTCVYCHKTHVVDGGLKDQQAQREQCSKCHGRRLETHVGGEALLEGSKCTACHKVHELKFYAAPSDDDPSIEAWGARYPEYVEMYLETKDSSTPTPFGGNVPYSKLMRFPGKTALWDGFAFAVDFNEDRGHYYSQIDQLNTKRVDREYLNANGLAAFRGQPSACMNCHSGWAPQQIDEIGWDKFNNKPYFDTVAKLRERHGHGVEGADLGSACADCHAPDMRLRVNRQGFINAMVQRGYEADPISGLKGTREEMQDHVCGQCHVEYYFAPGSNELVFPWADWPKGQPFKFEMVEAYYERARSTEGGFQRDWVHAVTKAPMLKMQHPEYELTSSGEHANLIGCVDCHMPKIEREGKILTDHSMGSPLNRLDSCLGCHDDMTEDQMYQRVVDVQVRNMAGYIRAEKAVVALIQDIGKVRAALAGKEPFSEIEDAGEREAAISEALAEVLDYHRRASFRWDWIGAENSSGAHSPTEALRVLEMAIGEALKGQQRLKTVAAGYDIKLAITTDPEMPAAPAPIEPDNIVGSPPTRTALEADKAVMDLLKQ